jgi:hypothetical protein
MLIKAYGEYWSRARVDWKSPQSPWRFKGESENQCLCRMQSILPPSAVKCCHHVQSYGSSPHLVKTLKASAVEVGAPVYAALRTRILSRSKLARPYMERLINLRRCTFPSTGPLLQP